MKKFLGLLIVLSFVFLSFACAKNEVNMGKGKNMTLEFVSNPTTGFDWDYAFNTGENGGELELVENTFIAPEEEGVFGAAGKRKFVFKGKKAGKLNIIFTYRRLWEGGETAYDVVYELDVKEDMSITCLSKTKGVVDSDKDLMSFPDPTFD